MPVPLPVELVMGALPMGFQGNLQEYANAIVDNITATVEGTFLTGQIGGPMPTSDIGPWANGDEWWFWDPVSGQYQPSDQGTPVGTVCLWGGQGTPTNWLLCGGQAVSRMTYSRLFQVIGTTWGVGDGSSTFNLPPGGVFYINAQGFNPVNTIGGSQTCYLQLENMPSIRAQVWTAFFGCESGGTQVPGVAAGPSNSYQVDPCVDANLVPLGSARQPISIMPPYASINYIIKYQ
jgi:microcystin-dependent protein